MITPCSSRRSPSIFCSRISSGSREVQVHTFHGVVFHFLGLINENMKKKRMITAFSEEKKTTRGLFLELFACCTSA